MFILYKRFGTLIGRKKGGGRFQYRGIYMRATGMGLFSSFQVYDLVPKKKIHLNFPIGGW